MGKQWRKEAHLCLAVAAALRAMQAFLLDVMPFVARMLDHHPMVRHGLLAAIKAAGVLGIDDPALIVRSLDPLPVLVHVLVCANDRIQAHRHPCLGEEHIFLIAPLDPRLGRLRHLGDLLLRLAFCHGRGCFFLYEQLS